MIWDIRKVIKITGTTFALLIGMILPLGYLVDDYLEASDHVRSEAERSAAKVSLFVARTGPLRVSTSDRLASTIADRPPRELEKTRQRVIGPDRRTIYSEAGQVAGPVITELVPINLDGATVGWVEARESLRPLVIETGLVALFSVFLSCGALLLFRVFPLRVLDRTLTRLEAQEAELRNQCLISESALNNMTQGLCMFDADRRLITCNRRYTELYSLPKELTLPGTPLSAILEHRVRSGSYSKDPDSYFGERLDMVTQDQSRADVVEQKDGRTVEIRYDPLPGGGWVATHEDISARRQAEARITYLASHDFLTNLPNRVLFRECLADALGEVPNGKSFAIHSVDLDRFKEINDTYGHSTGDAVLQEVAERLRAHLRESETVARLGGDEFAVIQPELERPEDASYLAERLIEVISAPYPIDGQYLALGATIGVTIAPNDGGHLDQLLKNADMALYRAKSDGRGIVRFFEKEMDLRLQARRRLEQELRLGVKYDQFQLYFQPLLNISSNKISGFEALLRWNHPERGMVPPDEFIPLAEETGLIVEIGAWVIAQACLEAAKWPSEITVAVNLSSVQFKSNALFDTVVEALAESGLAPARLELEITETVLLQNSEITLSTLHKLRSLGVRFAMDDFGTGYSSLSYLRSFPFHKIKIDRSFVHHLPRESGSAAIVRAVTALARDLGMITTAEGVENEQTLDILRKSGCTEIQGFLISPAQPATAVPDLLSKFGASGISPNSRGTAALELYGGKLVRRRDRARATV